MNDFDKNNVRRLARNFANHINKNLLPNEEEDLKVAAMKQIAEAYHLRIIEIISIFEDEYLRTRHFPKKGLYKK